MSAKGRHIRSILQADAGETLWLVCHVAPGSWALATSGAAHNPKDDAVPGALGRCTGRHDGRT